jgi:hypothetical protein
VADPPPGTGPADVPPHGSTGGHGSHDDSDEDDSGDRHPPRHSGGGSQESAPRRNFIERVFDDLGIPLP